jgi:hypothetical protein
VIYSFMGSDLPTTGEQPEDRGNTFPQHRITGSKSPVVKLSEATGTVIEGNTITAGSSLTTYEFRDGQGNVVQRNTVGGNTTVNTVRSSTSQPVAATTLRDPALGRDISVQHSPSGGATTTVEDSRSYVWKGADVTAATNQTRGTITGAVRRSRARLHTCDPPATHVTSR